MLIIMAGIPKCGKTIFVDKLVDELEKKGSVRVVSPSHTLKAWEDSLMKCLNLLSSSKDTVPKPYVILDTCAASPNTLSTIFSTAFIYDHKIAIVHVDRDPDECVQSGCDKEIVEEYTYRVSRAIDQYQRQKYAYVFVGNSASEEEFLHSAVGVAVQLEWLKNYVG